MRLIRIVLWTILTVGLTAAGGMAAQEDWKAEFEDICSKTDVAAMLNAADIKNLIERCDKLKPQIEKLDESAKKVYLRRLETCRNLFLFMINSNAQK